MKTVSLCLAFVIAFLPAFAGADEPTAAKKPYNIEVWADLSFDENSQLASVTIPQKEQFPAPFVNYLTSSIASAPFTKPENAEANKQLESGLRIIVEIDPNTSKAKLLSQELMPRPVRAEQQSEPVLRVKGEWSGRLLVTCAISKNGRCAKPKIDQSMNAPGEIPKVLQATLGSWRFVPQKRAGVAIDGEFTTWVTIEADESAPPATFDKRI